MLKSVIEDFLKDKDICLPIFRRQVLKIWHRKREVATDIKKPGMDALLDIEREK